MYSSDRMRRNRILLIFFRHYVERPDYFWDNSRDWERLQIKPSEKT